MRVYAVDLTLTICHQQSTREQGNVCKEHDLREINSPNKQPARDEKKISHGFLFSKTGDRFAARVCGSITGPKRCSLPDLSHADW